MRICRYNEGRVGLIDGDVICPLGDALHDLGLTRTGATMSEVVGALARDNMEKVVASARRLNPVALSSARLLAPTDDPPAIWAAAANYRSHQSEMTERVGAYDRSKMSPDDLMAEVFLKPSSSIVGPGGTVILPEDDALDILSVKYSVEGTAADPVLVATMKVSDLTTIPPESNWRVHFTANAPDSVLSPTGEFSFGVSDRGDQFFLRATTGPSGTQTFSYGTAVRTFSGPVAYTDKGTGSAATNSRPAMLSRYR